MEADEDSQKSIDIIGDAKIGMFTTIDEDGRLVSRPLTVQQTMNDADLWFVADRGTSLVDEVRRNPGVNVSFSTKDAWVSVSGDAETVDDPEKAKELWNQMDSAWFPDGPDSPGVVLIHVASVSAQYWDSPGLVGTAIDVAKARLTGTRVDTGETGETDL